MNTLLTQANQYTASLAAGLTFAEKYGERLPNPIAGLCVTPERTEVFISIGYIKEDRNRVLSLVGEVFGCDGWKRRREYNNETFCWWKDVDGVRISISRVENIEIPLNDSPVPQNAFPLQIADAA